MNDELLANTIGAFFSILFIVVVAICVYKTSHINTVCLQNGYAASKIDMFMNGYCIRRDYIKGYDHAIPLKDVEVKNRL